MIKAQGVLDVFSIDTPPPSAVARFLVITMLSSVRLALPWSRMPPPVPVGPSPGDAMPFSIVKPFRVTVKAGWKPRRRRHWD